jgi:hypothetical protein
MIGTRVEHLDLERLVAAAPLDDAELDPLPGLEFRGAGRERVLVHEDVGTALAGEEAEALLRVEPLHLAAGHVVPSVSRRRSPAVVDGASPAGHPMTHFPG